jgi:AraC-like DNA-binding protein
MALFEDDRPRADGRPPRRRPLSEFGPLPADDALARDAAHNRRRFEHWREEFRARVSRVEIEARDVEHFRAELRVQTAAGISLSENLIAGASSFMRTSDTLRNDPDIPIFLVCYQGRIDTRYGDDGTPLAHGQAAFVPHHRPGGVIVDRWAKTFRIGIAHELVRRYVPSLESVMLRPARADEPAMMILRAYCKQLASLPAEMSANFANVASGQLAELVGNVFDPTADAVRAAEFGGVRAARLQAIKQSVAQRLGDFDLSVGQIAARLRVSPRYVQMLFESEGTTFSQYVLAERLARAHRMLQDPRFIARNISEIAYQAGFGDLSNFNHAFRRRYGVTPSDVRADAVRARR